MNLAEKSYRHIRRQLTSGNLQPGSRLVNRTLADEIGVSVIPVREALNRLASEGLVEQFPGVGIFVRNLDRDELDHMYVLRDALESCAAAEAARHITEIQLEELEAILSEADIVAKKIAASTKGRATNKQFNVWLDLEEQFHLLLIEASRNPLLIKVINEHRAIREVFEAQRNKPELLTTETAQQTCHGKAELIKALKDRNAELARKLISDQIQSGRRSVLSYFRKHGTGSPNA
ncbi:GntR family transcriptional regulator [uncultured Gimesia sp.]|uniref:GntR family transcriptional regulator n=1 Tax=uncultured Gimesia sp. TaxID=1678688 RepID=UPI0030DD7A04|tara:strand:+ start:198244 stop:198945 length:702 start_codon:yes stop_codon:yes gene_type:complete